MRTSLTHIKCVHVRNTCDKRGREFLVSDFLSSRYLSPVNQSLPAEHVRYRGGGLRADGIAINSQRLRSVDSA